MSPMHLEVGQSYPLNWRTRQGEIESNVLSPKCRSSKMEI